MARMPVAPTATTRLDDAAGGAGGDGHKEKQGEKTGHWRLPCCGSRGFGDPGPEGFRPNSTDAQAVIGSGRRPKNNPGQFHSTPGETCHISWDQHGGHRVRFQPNSSPVTFRTQFFTVRKQ